MNVGIYELTNGRTLHIEQKGGGIKYACQVYDHGPFCRLCQPMDDILEACLENVIDGGMETRQDGEGEFSFTLTASGIDHAKHLIEKYGGAS